MKDYESEVGKLWLKKFKKADSEEQRRLHNLMMEIHPVKPPRSQGEKEELPESIKKKQRMQKGPKTLLESIKQSYMKA